MNKISVLLFLKARIKTARAIWKNEFVAPVKSMRIDYLPPLMVYFAYGVSGLTGVVGSFFVTKVLGMEANFLAILAFWAGIWWGFKMPIGHLVDLLWRFKALFVFLGAGLMTLGLGIMVGLTGYLDAMTKYMTAESWYIIAALATPFAFILQDVVADAMTVEAIPRFTSEGQPVDEKTLKIENTTMQLLGRAAVLFGGLIVAGAGGWFARIPATETGMILMIIVSGTILTVLSFKIYKKFSSNTAATYKKGISIGAILFLTGIAYLSLLNLCAEFIRNFLTDVESYEMVYWLAMIVPALSITGVLTAARFKRKKKKTLLDKGFSLEKIKKMLSPEESEKTKVNWWILGGSAIYLIILIPLGLLSLTAQSGLEKIPMLNIDIAVFPKWFSQNTDAVLLFFSLSIVSFLIAKLIKELPKEAKRILVGTAIFIFVYRATPSIGAGLNFFYIEILRISEGFMGTISQIGSIIALLGLFVLRPMMAKKSLAWICVFLTFFYSFFFLPIIGLVHGLHEWIAAFFSTDPLNTAKAILLIDVVIESPFGQLAMVPMLAWIAQYAPTKHKATYFAVMASFTNLALSASALGTRYLNEIFVITKPIFNKAGELIKAGDYTELPFILWSVFGISLVFPVLAIILFTKIKGREQLGFKILDASQYLLSVSRKKILLLLRKN